MTEKRFVRKGYSIWDNLKNEECYSLNYRHQCEDMCNVLNALHEENKIFREALKELKEIGDYQAMRIQELDDENEQFKSTIKEAYENERTQIGKNVLKQLIEQIEE